MNALRAMGIGRDADDERTLFVIFNRSPSDDEMRGVHELLGLRGVTSRAELNRDATAAARWKELRRAFEAWRRAGR